MASNYQNRLKASFESEGWLVIKLIRAGENGYPDLFCFRNGAAMVVESKEKNDTLKPLQKLRIDQLINKGIDAKCLQDTRGQIYPLLK